MNIKKHMITIDSLQRLDGEKNSTSFSTVGAYSLEGGIGEIVYHDSKLTGYEGSVTRLRVDGSRSVLLERTGSTNSRLLVEPGARNQSFYDLGFGSLSLAVGGASIENRLDENGGTVRFKYSLDVDSNVLSENEVTISIREISNARQIPV